MGVLGYLQYYGMIKDLLSWTARLLRRKTAAMESAEMPLVKQLPWGEARRGFRVAPGFRCAVVEAGAVQAQLDEGKYRRGDLRKIARRKALTADAKAVLYRQSEFPLRFAVRPLFTADHHELSLEIGAWLQVRPASLLDGAKANARPPASQLEKELAESLSLPARAWAASLSGEEIIRTRGMEQACHEKASEWIPSALDGSMFELARVVQARLCSGFLDEAYRKLAESAREQGELATALEQDRVRGACRQAILAGKLREIRDQSRFDDTVRALEQDRALKDKAMRMELGQRELDELQERIELSRRKYAVLQQALDAAAQDPRDPGRLMARMHEALSSAVDGADSPFSPQEREQIHELLRIHAYNQHTPGEILSAIAQGSGIRPPLFNPFAGLRGPHTLKVGGGWRIFDGENLWQVRLTSIQARRCGFLWLREAVFGAQFEIKGSPGERRLMQEVRAGEQGCLHIGPHDLPVEMMGGSAAQITLRVPTGIAAVPAA